MEFMSLDIGFYQALSSPVLLHGRPDVTCVSGGGVPLGDLHFGIAVDHFAALVVGKIDPLAVDDQAGILLEIAVAGERHPVLFERVRAGGVA